MRKSTLHKILFGATASAFLLLPVLMLMVPQRADSTTEAMQALPAFSKFQCALCHTSSAPVVGTATLNAFGKDFEDNAGIWDRTLAEMNSDGDRCTNGFELGDRDGDGQFDRGGQAIEHSNPGDSADCAVAVDQATWGALKEIFSQEFRQQHLLEASEIESYYQFSRYFP